MKYIHIKSLNDYHQGYKDRTLQWAKVYFTMVHGDPEFEMIESEIDKWRFVAMICLELQAHKPLPNLERYWISKHFNLAIRPMKDTLDALSPFIVYVTASQVPRYEDKIKSKIKSKNKKGDIVPISDKEFDFLWNKCYPGSSEQKGSKKKARDKIQLKRFSHTFDECAKAFTYYKDHSDNVRRGYVKQMITFINGGFIQQTLDAIKDKKISSIYKYKCPNKCKEDPGFETTIPDHFNSCEKCNTPRELDNGK